MVFPNGLAGIDWAALKRRTLSVAHKLIPKRGHDSSTSEPTPAAPNGGRP